MERYLRSTHVIDWESPRVSQLAAELASGISDPVEISRACYEWVRDDISHSGDNQAEVTTCSASEVLLEGTGWCFAKSHLLAALLRANRIPAALCYQRLLRDDGEGYTLHGLNAVNLPRIGWYRIDPRGNKADVDAQFSPPKEKLAWLGTEEGEINFSEPFSDPAPIIVKYLRDNAGYVQARENLPDTREI